jgi:capsid protein
MGWQEFGRSIDAWRWQLIIPRLCERVADWFIEAVPGMDQQPRDWTPPARTIVDPAREIPAIKDAIRTGLMTLPEAMREQGYDPQNMLKEIAEFNAAMDAAGVVLDSDPRQTSAAGTTQNTVTPNDNANTTNP